VNQPRTELQRVVRANYWHSTSEAPITTPKARRQLPKYVLECRHCDWNVVPSRQAGVRGRSRSLGRLSVPIFVATHKMGSMSALARSQQVGTQSTHIPELVWRIWNKSVYLHLFGNELVFCNLQPLNLRLDSERIDSELRGTTIPSGGSSFSQKSLGQWRCGFLRRTCRREENLRDLGSGSSRRKAMAKSVFSSRIK
jgi:hypothetical protein